jgi:DNA-binding LacI/PurR family transcriptional regulator
MSIVEVAKLAGVSFSTVSRVINGRPNVSPKKVEAVLRAMKEANYKPLHPSRRRGPNTRTRDGIHTQTVAMLFTGMKEKRLSNKPAMSDVMHSVQRCLAGHEMNMVAAFVDGPGDLPPVVSRGEIDGILVCGYQPSEELAMVLSSIPAVWVMSPHSGYSSTVDCVYPDDEAIGKLAAEYLIGEGRKELVCLSGVHKYGGFGVRAEAFLRYGINNDADVEVISVEDVGLDIDDPGVEDLVHPAMIDRIAESEKAVTGIFLVTDLMAARTYRLLKERGVRPGEDVSIISFNKDDPQLESLSPRPMTIDINADDVAKCAVEQLLVRLSDGNGEYRARRRILIEPELFEIKN